MITLYASSQAWVSIFHGPFPLSDDMEYGRIASCSTLYPYKANFFLEPCVFDLKKAEDWRFYTDHVYTPAAEKVTLMLMDLPWEDIAPEDVPAELTPFKPMSVFTPELQGTPRWRTVEVPNTYMRKLVTQWAEGYEDAISSPVVMDFIRSRSRNDWSLRKLFPWLKPVTE